MNFLLQNILSYLLLYKYAALFLVTFLAALALPIPSAATVMASAAFAGQGYLSLPWVVVIASLGNIFGDNIGYWVARVYGKPVLYKIGFRKVLESPKLRGIEERVRQKPGLFVFFSRFEVIMTLSVNALSGLGKMKYSRYLFYEVSGEVFQVCIYAAFGYFFGSDWQVISNIFGQLWIVFVLVAAFFLVVYWKKIVNWLGKKE